MKNNDNNSENFDHIHRNLHQQINILFIPNLTVVCKSERALWYLKKSALHDTQEERVTGEKKNPTGFEKLHFVVGVSQHRKFRGRSKLMTISNTSSCDSGLMLSLLKLYRKILALKL